MAAACPQLRPRHDGRRGLNKVFNEGVAAGRPAASAKRHEVQRALKTNPQCSDCYYNIGVANAGKKDLDKAEEAYKKAVEIKPSAEAYNGLVNVYTAQRKMDEAAAAGKKAAELSASTPGGAANPDATYNQGVIAFNAGNLADAKAQFQATIAAKPDHAEAHYRLGNVFVGEGNFGEAVKEFEMYLKLAPSGPNAKTAQDNVTALKPLVK